MRKKKEKGRKWKIRKSGKGYKNEEDGGKEKREKKKNEKKRKYFNNENMVKDKIAGRGL